jgi:hypothetical protein
MKTMSVFLALALGLMAMATTITMTACDGNKKPKVDTAKQQLDAKRDVAPVTVNPDAHFRGKDGPNGTGGPPTGKTNGQ